MRRGLWLMLVVVVVAVAVISRRLVSQHPRHGRGAHAASIRLAPPRARTGARFREVRWVVVGAPLRAPFEFVPPEQKQVARAMRRALEKPISFSFEGRSLRFVLDFFRDRAGLNMVFADEKTGWTEDRLVSLSGREMPCWDAMELVFLQTDCAWTFRRRALYVGTPGAVYTSVARVDRTYDLTPVLPGLTAADAREVARIVGNVFLTQSEFVDLSLYERDAALSAMPLEAEMFAVTGTRFVVTATPNEHLRLQNLLRLLQAASEGNAWIVAPKPLPVSAGDRELEERLRRPLGPVHLEGASIRDAVDQVRLDAEIATVCMVIPEDEMRTVTLTAKGLTVRQVLDMIVAPSYRWFALRGALIVAPAWSPIHVARFETRLYDVHHLAGRDVAGGDPEDALVETLDRVLKPCPAARAASADRRLWRGYLVVTAYEAEHRRLRRLLAATRQPTPIGSARGRRPPASRLTPSGRPGKECGTTRTITKAAVVVM